MTPHPRRITLRNGVEMSTPLLIPSLSSRATGPHAQSERSHQTVKQNW